MRCRLGEKAQLYHRFFERFYRVRNYPKSDENALTKVKGSPSLRVPTAQFLRPIVFTSSQCGLLDDVWGAIARLVVNATQRGTHLTAALAG